MLKQILAFFLLMQLTTVCFSDESIKKNKVFIVGVTSFDYAPHYFMDGRRFSGFARDVLDLFAKKSGYEFKYQPRPYVRMVKELLTGETDFQYPDNPHWLNDQKSGHNLFYSNGVIQYIDGIIRWKSDFGKPLSTLKRIAMPRGWTPVDYLPLVRRGELIAEEEDQVGSVIDMLLHNRVDGSYLNIDVATYYLESHKISGQIGFDPSLPYQFSQYSLSSTLHPEIIKEFDQFLIDSAAAIVQIKNKYKFRFDTDPMKKRK
jgi:hypothetical protein